MQRIESKPKETVLPEIKEQVILCISNALKRHKGESTITFLAAKDDMEGYFFGLYFKDGKAQIETLDEVIKELNSTKNIVIETPFEITEREGYYFVEFTLEKPQKVRKKKPVVIVEDHSDEDDYDVPISSKELIADLEDLTDEITDEITDENE